MRPAISRAAAALGVAVAAAPLDLRAEPPLDAFRPALDARGFVTVDGGDVLAPGDPSFGLVTSWARGLAGADDVVSPTFVAAIGLPARLQLALSLPFGIASIDGGGIQGVGDAGIVAKAGLVERGRWLVAAAAGATLPTATHAGFGAGAAGGSARAIVERRAGRWRLAGNGGIGARAGGRALPVGAAAAWAITPARLDVIGEVGASIPLDGAPAPVEATVGLRVRLAEASHFTIGAGTALGGDGPDLRAFAAILFEPRRPVVRRVEVPDPPAVAVVPPPPAPPADEPEAPLDSDGDTFFDHEDLCPDDAEDFDGVEDEDGCSEPGERVAYTGGELELYEEIFFELDSAVIEERSHAILRAIARSLAGNADILRVEIGGHTDARGSAAYNRALSQRRADAVRDFLIAEGVAGERLDAVGYGEDVPKQAGRGEAVWAVNRRVELLIRERR